VRTDNPVSAANRSLVGRLLRPVANSAYTARAAATANTAPRLTGLVPNTGRT
jgi:hypothetical protein